MANASGCRRGKFLIRATCYVMNHLIDNEVSSTKSKVMMVCGQL
jgi:hypothetical protein